MFEIEENKHPKYGAEITRGRRSNGWHRSNVRQHKLELSLCNTSNFIWTTGVFFDENKDRLVWFSNLWHRRFWRIIFNRRIRHIKGIPNNNFYRKLFYLVLNCDRVSLGYHGVKKARRQAKEKIIVKKYHECQVRTARLQWTPIHGKI